MIYVNCYWVEVVKVMIIDVEFDNYSLLVIGLEAGFFLKIIFYIVFKKMMGMILNRY